jgi:hypothetical protein
MPTEKLSGSSEQRHRGPDSCPERSGRARISAALVAPGKRDRVWLERHRWFGDDALYRLIEGEAASRLHG